MDAMGNRGQHLPRRIARTIAVYFLRQLPAQFPHTTGIEEGVRVGRVVPGVKLHPCTSKAVLKIPYPAAHTGKLSMLYQLGAPMGCIFVQLSRNPTVRLKISRFGTLSRSGQK